MSKKNDTIVVGFPLYQGCTLLDFTGATQMFTPYTGAGFKPVWIAEYGWPVITTEGVAVTPNYTFETAPEVDILFIPGGGGSGVSAAMLDDSFVENIDKLADKASYAGSVCTGAFIFGATGRFSGLAATTYWSQLGNLSLFPDVTVAQDSYPPGLFNPPAGGKTIFSGGGVSSSIDLSLELINRIRGQETCETVQLANQYAPDPPYRSGNPSEAPTKITENLRKAQIPFTEQIRKATEQVIAKM